MREDGAVAYYLVQHRDAQDGWADSALGYFLFKDLTYAQKTGATGERYRALLGPQSAFSDLWQRYGIHGYERREDADAALAAVRWAAPDTQFRLVHRASIQHTQEVND